MSWRHTFRPRLRIPRKDGEGGGRGGIAGKAQARDVQARAEDNGKDVHDRVKQKETVANRIQNPMAFESLTYLSIFILYLRWAVLEREPGSADLL